MVIINFLKVLKKSIFFALYVTFFSINENPFATNFAIVMFSRLHVQQIFFFPWLDSTHRFSERLMILFTHLLYGNTYGHIWKELQHHLLSNNWQRPSTSTFHPAQHQEFPAHFHPITASFQASLLGKILQIKPSTSRTICPCCYCYMWTFHKNGTTQLAAVCCQLQTSHVRLIVLHCYIAAVDLSVEEFRIALADQTSAQVGQSIAENYVSVRSPNCTIRMMKVQFIYPALAKGQQN